MLAVDVKAIALLNTHSEAGFSLLLLIFGQFPAIQLSFGFTLTGVGGLIGVQHTASPPALSQALGAGQLDAVLFPGESGRQRAADHQHAARRCFRSRAAASSSGRCWSSGGARRASSPCASACSSRPASSRCSARPSSRSRRSSRRTSRCCTCGSTSSARSSSIRCAIAFDAKLIHSRVALISITGQFAFRAQFGDNPTFLISAGGFHPRFKEVPSDIPTPFDRVGASLDIGIVGIELKGYFAITSATIQAGAALRVWADIGIASIEGGFGFDAICYLVPKFYFELDIFAYLDVHVFGIDFASIHLDGTLAGPGRWHIAGNAEVHTPWPLPDFSVHIDESWGTDRDTPQITVNVANELRRRSARSPTGARSCRRAATGSSRSPTSRRYRRARASARHAGLPAEARAVRAAHGQGERQQD